MASGSYQLIWVAGGASGSGTVTLASLPQTGATTGQAIVWNGSAWAPATVTGGATGASILNGAGAPLTSTGNIGDFYVDNNTLRFYGPKSSYTPPSYEQHTYPLMANGNDQVANGTAQNGTVTGGAVIANNVMTCNANAMGGLRTPAALLTNFTGDFTFECWFTRTISASGTDILVCFAADQNNFLIVNPSKNGTPQIVFGISGTYYTLTTSASITQNSYYYFAITYTASSKIAQVYLNATASGNITLPSSFVLSAQASSSTNGIGGFSPFSQDPGFTGNIDSVVLSTVALTQSQISSNYQNKGANGPWPKYISLIETSGNTAGATVVRDGSGNFSAGTITAALSGNAATATSATNYTGSVALSQLAQTSATSGQVIAWSGTAWAPATPASGGGTSGITQLNGDVTTPASSSGNTTATVASVGGSSASAVNTAVTTVSAATSSATASTLVARDSSSGFIAGKVGFASGSASANSMYLGTDATTGFYFNNSLVGCAVGNGVIWTANTTTWTCIKAASFSGNVTVGLNLLLSGFSSGTLTVKAASTTTSHTYVMPGAQGAASTYLQNDGSGNLSWAAASGGSSGTVTSVALSDASSTPIYTVSGSPVTTSGTLSLALNSQSIGTVFCAPATGGAVPTFQSLALGHLPTATAQAVLRSPGTAGASSGSPVWGKVYAPDMLSPSATSGQVLTSTGAATAPTWQTPSSGGITALTGDVTASGTGSVAATVAQVGGQTSTAVATAATSVANSTSNNTVSTLAARDANGAIQMSTGVTPLNTATITVTAAQSGTTFIPTTGSNVITLIPNPANISYKYKILGAGGAVSISPPSTGTTPTFYYFGGTTTNAINQVNTNTSDCIEFTGLPGSSNYMVSNIQGNWQSGGNALGVYSSLSYPSTSGYVLTANGSTGGASFQAAAGGSSAPNIVASTTTPTASDTGKIFIATTATTATLPVSPATNTQYTYVNGSGGTQTIAQGTGAQVYYGNTATTSGTGGSIVLNGQGSSITIVCQASTNIWYKINSSGQATVT